MNADRDQIKSRERVRDLAEVYTHQREVDAMLDLVPDMFTRIGPMARTAADCRAILDATWSPNPIDPIASSTDLAGLRIGVDRLAGVTAATDDGQPEAFEQALAVFAEAGAEIVECALPRYVEVTAANYVIMLSEGLAYHLPGLRERWHDYGRSTRQLLSGGLAYSGPDYVQAQRVRARSWQETSELFEQVDFHLSPMATVGAPTLHDLLEGDQSLGFGSLHTPYWATVGNPTAAVPIDVAVLNVAAAFQERTDHHLARPPL